MREEAMIPEDFENLEKYAPVLAKTGRNNPFMVPDGYFEELPSRYFLSFLNKNSGFAVPDDYFENFISGISARTMNAEMQDMPANYFEELAGLLKSRIAIENLKGENPFAAPENYFEDLPAVLSSRLKIEQSSGKELPFITPAAYFENNAERIKQKLHPPGKEKKVRVISIFRRQYGIIAAAASAALLIGIFFFLKKPSRQVSEKAIAELASAHKNTIIANADMYGIDESSILEKITDTELIREKLDLDSQQEEIIDYLNDNSIDIESTFEDDISSF